MRVEDNVGFRRRDFRGSGRRRADAPVIDGVSVCSIKECRGIVEGLRGGFVHKRAERRIRGILVGKAVGEFYFRAFCGGRLCEHALFHDEHIGTVGDERHGFYRSRAVFDAAFR